MSKQKRKTQKNQIKRNQQLLALGIVMVVAVLATIFLINQTGDDNVDTGTATAQLISPADYQSDFDDSQHVLLDVRTPAEFADGYIEGATNIAVETLEQRISEVPTDQPIVLYCRSGNRSAQAARILTNAGYTQVYDMGGILQWQDEGYPVVR